MPHTETALVQIWYFLKNSQNPPHKLLNFIVTCGSWHHMYLPFVSLKKINKKAHKKSLLFSIIRLILLFLASYQINFLKASGTKTIYHFFC